MNKKNVKFINEYFQKKNCLSLVKVWRFFAEYKYEVIPLAEIGQESDGPIFILLSNNDVLGFYPNTELCSIDFSILELKDIPNVAIEVSNVAYWKNRIKQKIISVRLEQSSKEFPASVSIHLDNGNAFRLVYISESSYTFDALVLR